MKKFLRVLKWVLIILVFVLIWFGWDYYTRPIPLETVSQPIEINEEPHQDSNISIDSISFDSSRGEVVLTPVAYYDISAQVVGRKNYYTGFDAKFEPTDLALAWGKLTEPEYNQDITYSQSGRWYHFRYGPDAKLPENYIASHSVNTHIVPASDNIKKAVRRIKKGDQVNIKGYLVNIEAKDFKQRTSMTRTDIGSGACEILYAERIQIGNRVYE